MNATARHIMQHPWQPGWYGKGIVTPSGRPYTWITSEEDGDAFDFETADGDMIPVTHQAGAHALGYTGGYYAVHPFIIGPDGTFAFHSVDITDEVRAAVAMIHPTLHQDQAQHDEIYNAGGWDW